MESIFAHYGPRLSRPGWATKRIAHLIELRLGVNYHPAHVSRLLRAVGWSVQQPIQQAT